MKLLRFISHNLDLPHCSICHQAKQTRQPFPSSSSTCYNAPFQLLHMDVWGPFHISTYKGERYFLTIVDEYTRVTWIYLMQSKLDVYPTIKRFIFLIHNQFSTTIKIIRTDNALDFFKSGCTSFFSSLGIIHQSSCAYTPQ